MFRIKIKYQNKLMTSTAAATPKHTVNISQNFFVSSKVKRHCSNLN